MSAVSGLWRDVFFNGRTISVIRALPISLI